MLSTSTPLLMALLSIGLVLLFCQKGAQAGGGCGSAVCDGSCENCTGTGRHTLRIKRGSGCGSAVCDGSCENCTGIGRRHRRNFIDSPPVPSA